MAFGTMGGRHYRTATAKKGGGGVKLVVVVIEYFKNWVKAKALAHITIGIED